MVSECQLLAGPSLLCCHSSYPISCQFIKLHHIAIFDTTNCLHVTRIHSTTFHNGKISHFHFSSTYLTWLQCVYICNTMKYFDSQMAPISFHCIHNYSIKSKNPLIPNLILLFPSNSIKEKFKRQIQTKILQYHVFALLEISSCASLL